MDADLKAISAADETISKEMGHWDSGVIGAQEVVVRGQAPFIFGHIGMT